MKDENRSSIGEKMKISDGEKLIMLMLCEINDKIEQNSIKDDFIDFKFIKTAILKNSEWSLFYKFKGLNLQAPTEIEVKEVIGVLEMWDMIEISYSKLSYYDKLIVDKEACCKPIFTGFRDIREDKYLDQYEESAEIEIYDNILNFEFGKMYQLKEIEELIHTSKAKLNLEFYHQGSVYKEKIKFFHIKYGWVVSGFFHYNYEICNKNGNPLFKKILNHNCYFIYPSKVFDSINNLWKLIDNDSINVEQAQLLMNEIGIWIDDTNKVASKNIVSLTDGSDPFKSFY